MNQIIRYFLFHTIKLFLVHIFLYDCSIFIFSHTFIHIYYMKVSIMVLNSNNFLYHQLWIDRFNYFDKYHLTYIKLRNCINYPLQMACQFNLLYFHLV